LVLTATEAAGFHDTQEMPMPTKRRASTATKQFEDIVTNFRKRAFIARDFDAIQETVTEDFVDHFAPPWDPPGVAGVRQRFSQAANSFHTLQVEIVKSMSKGRFLTQAIKIHLRHVGEFMGIEPTGKEIAIAGFDMFEFREGKIAGHWGVYDVTRIPDLLGQMPPPSDEWKAPRWSEMWNGGEYRGAGGTPSER
jgi:predicted ester cyclase